MSRIAALLLIGAMVACADTTTSPPTRPIAPSRALAAADETGPPPHHTFGPDTYRVGLFTGQGITRPKLDCDGSTSRGRSCNGFLASSVDGTLLDVRVDVPAGEGPLPLVVL